MEGLIAGRLDEAAVVAVHPSLDQPPVAVPELKPPSLTPGKDALGPP